jgi:hypothetical protein
MASIARLWLRPLRAIMGAGPLRFVSTRCIDVSPSIPPARPREIDLASNGFLTLRREGMAYVDKTSAIADVLTTRRLSQRAFFSRPRRFGKSQTISVMAEMLAAGKLPSGVTPWPGYEPVDTDAVFGGLDVHRRWMAGDVGVTQLMERAYFVVKLPLGDAQTGTKLERSIIERLSYIAGDAFGPDLKAEVARSSTPGSALDALALAVPRKVPIAVLVDEYDQAILNDVAKRRWEAGEEGIAALRSLMMATKAQGLDNRLERFIVTGAARFARASLFSGANNFIDLTPLPICSRMLGFTEQEIRANFPEELVRLGKSVAAAKSTDEALRDAAIETLEWWHNGYCFDGASICFNPAPVLSSLAAGKVTGREMEGASSTTWFGLAPAAVLGHDYTRTVRTVVQNFDIADLQANKVNATALLVQAGLLSLQPAAAVPDSEAGAAYAAAAAEADPSIGSKDLVTLQAPNEYARNTLLHLVATMTERALLEVTGDALRARKAVSMRDHVGFASCLRELLASIPHAMTKMKAAADGPPPREAPFHTCAYGFLRAALPHNICNLVVEQQSAFGTADIVLELKDSASEQPSAVWIVELGAVTPKADRTAQQLVDQKGMQVRDYYKRYSSLPGKVLALVVDREKADVLAQWQEWDVQAQQRKRDGSPPP